MGGSQFLDYLWANKTPDKWRRMEEFNNSAKPMRTLGWTCNMDNVKTEIATIASVGKTCGEPITEGVVSYDVQYPKMKKAFATAGVA